MRRYGNRHNSHIARLVILCYYCLTIEKSEQKPVLSHVVPAVDLALAIPAAEVALVQDEKPYQKSVKKPLGRSRGRVHSAKSIVPAESHQLKRAKVGLYGENSSHEMPLPDLRLDAPKEIRVSSPLFVVSQLGYLFIRPLSCVW